jgi:AcrR family transcriptional regulator
VNARERSRVETRRRLIEAGIELFSERGVASAPAADIAERAGVAVGTLYLHFHDKLGLLRAILQEGAEELLRPLRKLAENPPKERFAAIKAHTDVLVRFVEEQPRFCRILFDPESIRSNVTGEITDYLITVQEQRLRDEMAAGAIQGGIDAAIASHAIVGMFIGVFSWLVKNQTDISHAVIVETISRFRQGLYGPDTTNRG